MPIQVTPSRDLFVGIPQSGRHIKFNGDAPDAMRSFLLVGAVTYPSDNSARVLSRGDNQYLRGYLKACIELGFPIAPDFTMTAVNLPDEDFLALDGVTADGVLFCNIYHNAEDIYPEMFSECAQSPLAHLPDAWANALEKTGARIAGNIHTAYTLEDECLSATGRYERKPLPKKVSMPDNLSVLVRKIL